MERVVMPQGLQFALTWSIPDEYGGMTAAMLARSSAFSRLCGVPVDVLTFDARPDTADLEARLRELGAIDAGVRLVNLYDWLRRHPLPGGLLATARDVFTPLGEDDATETVRRGAVVTSRIRTDGHGRTLQVDHYRADGTLLLSDRCDTRTRGVVGGRSIVLCDVDGRPIRSWKRIWPLYTAWLDALTAGVRSFMIVDSKTVARFMLTYRRPHVITAHVVHASHRSGAGDEHPIRQSRRAVFDDLQAFDLVALLSRRQAGDVEQAVGPTQNVVVIPNARPVAIAHGGGPRDPDRGMVLAALTPRKRVAHAAEAVRRARADAPGIHLDIYGDGESRSDLERTVAGESAVRLRGFDPHARRELSTASFLLLTSRSEGFPLVLLESMAAGCLPIAYDVRYGPSDLIRNGRNGFIVPSGDIDALAATIVRLRRLPPRRVAAMRRRAIRAARRLDEERITRLWARELRRAAVRRELRRSHRFRSIRGVAARSRLAAPARVALVGVAAGFDRLRPVRDNARR